LYDTRSREENVRVDRVATTAVAVIVIALSTTATATATGAAAATGPSGAAMTYGNRGDPTDESAMPRHFRQILGWGDCNPGEMCLFVNINGGGGGFAWSPNGSTGDF
jgi:hypothetical protein